MAPPKVKHTIPKVIQNVDDEIKDDIKACFLAGALSKREFKQKHRNCLHINCAGVMKEVSARVSSQHPQPQDAFPWGLAKRIIVGVLKVRIYTLDDAVAQHNRFLKELEYVPDLQKLNEPWDLPEVSLEPPDINEVLMDPKLLSHIADRDIFQIEEIEHFRDDINDATNFGSLTSEELSIYTSSDWMKAIQEQEERLAQGNQLKCIHPGTPKRKKAPSPGGNGSPPPGTPSKRPRRNLDDDYQEAPRPEETADVPFHDATDDLAAPLPGESSVPTVPSISLNDLPLPPDDTPIQAPPAPAAPSPVPEGVPPAASPRPQPPRRRVRPQPTQIPENKMKKRIADINVDTLPMEELVIDIRKIQNDATMLFKHPSTSWLDRGYAPIARVLAEDYARLLRVRPSDQLDRGYREMWESVEIMLAEVNAAAAEEQIIHDVSAPEDRNAEGENVVADPSVPEAQIVPEVSVENVPMPKEATDNDGPGVATGEDFEFRVSQTRRSQSRESRSAGTEASSEPYPRPIGMTRKEFHEALNAKWKEKMERYNLAVAPPVDFDEVVKPAERTPLDYTLAMSYAMDSMMKGKLLVQQVSPYGVVKLSPRGS